MLPGKILFEIYLLSKNQHAHEKHLNIESIIRLKSSQIDVFPTSNKKFKNHMVMFVSQSNLF